MRRIRTREPTCLSVGFGDFFSVVLGDFFNIFFSAAPRVASDDTRSREDRGLRMFPSDRQIKFHILELKRTARLLPLASGHNLITVRVIRKFLCSGIGFGPWRRVLLIGPITQPIWRQKLSKSGASMLPHGVRRLSL
jgi:hypothetical protein